MLETMPRPRLPRTIAARPVATLFKPGGIPGVGHLRMTLEEFEAVRLADLERLLQVQAARRMGVSRPTFGRILGSARRKIAEALVLGRALHIEADASAPARGCTSCPRGAQELVHLGRGKARR
jgi:predicted DNA-binding protein (UPF0251 family)